jgi:hypothetical protein
MPASKFWYVGMYLKSKGRFVKKSTGCELLNDAKEFAKDWYEDRILERRTYRDFGVQSFRAFSERFQTTQQRQISRGELVEEMFYNAKVQSARFYFKRLLPRTRTHAETMLAGADSLLDMPEEAFAI